MADSLTMHVVKVGRINLRGSFFLLILLSGISKFKVLEVFALPVEGQGFMCDGVGEPGKFISVAFCSFGTEAQRSDLLEQVLTGIWKNPKWHPFKRIAFLGALTTLLLRPWPATLNSLVSMKPVNTLFKHQKEPCQRPGKSPIPPA